MKLVIVAVFVISAIFGISTLYAEERVPTLTDRDLEQYRGQSSHPSPKDSTAQRKGPSGRDLHTKEIWCKRGTKATNRVDTARENLETIKKRLKEAEAESENRPKKSFDTRKKRPGKTQLYAAEKKLKKAEQEKTQLEQEAHRKSIPPGWLRCQFDY